MFSRRFQRMIHIPRDVDGENKSITSLCVNLGSDRVLSCSHDGEAKIIDADTGEILQTFVHPADVCCGVFNVGNPNEIFTCGWSSLPSPIFKWNIVTGQQVSASILFYSMRMMDRWPGPMFDSRTDMLCTSSVGTLAALWLVALRIARFAFGLMVQSILTLQSSRRLIFEIKSLASVSHLMMWTPSCVERSKVIYWSGPVRTGVPHLR